ncbi:MAG: hypothetical protein F8N15_00400 [Methanobacterium sp.]|nr:hypothetical protein [Methanobacterium sp.]
MNNDEQPVETTEDDLARLVKEWRGEIPVSRAAQILGIPKRTLEGIEQGRSFRYNRLLILALRAFR